jgi:TolA-binding protein
MRNVGIGLVVLTVVAGWGSAGCGLFVPTMKEHKALEERSALLERRAEEERQELLTVKEQLDDTRKRLDAALKANADNGAEQFSDRAKLSNVQGRVDEQQQALDDLRRNIAQQRTEIDARLDELKRTEEAMHAPKPPPVQVPADKAAHFAAVEQAHEQKDWALTRTLAREYAERYPDDDKTDDALYLSGDASMKDGRPSASLVDFNKVLKQFPKSNVLGQTLFAMGDAYLAMHDCGNARLAFAACESRFGKDPLGRDAKQRVKQIDAPPAGLCAPP